MEPETLLEFTPLTSADGDLYRARARGRSRQGGTWEGWLEFESVEGTRALRTARETTQPNRTDLVYWATGITAVYLEGALARALERRSRRASDIASEPAFEGPADELPQSGAHAEALDLAPEAEALDPILDPFEVYARGEAILRAQLYALATWHVRHIARAYRIVRDPLEAEAMTKPSLVDAIVAAARDTAHGEHVRR